MGNDLLSEGFIDFLTIFPMGKEKGIQPKHVQDCLNLFAVFHTKNYEPISGQIQLANKYVFLLFLIS
jgi:hypothetical protein